MAIREKSSSAGGCSSVVERALRMCEVPGSIPGISKQPPLVFLLPPYRETRYLHYLYSFCSRALGPPNLKEQSKRKAEKNSEAPQKSLWWLEV